MAHIFDHQKRSLRHSRRLIACGGAFLVVLMMASAGMALIHLSQGKAAEAAGSSKRITAAPNVAATSSPTSTPLPAAAPVSKAWYFPEGKVGQGFTEYLILCLTLHLLWCILSSIKTERERTDQNQ